MHGKDFLKVGVSGLLSPAGMERKMENLERNLK